ncbi:MAG: hypothetical protein LBO65_05760 [Spirochaetaceae bacterium]|nr:hypothetical protein [Spirochaetaceae bacterium]
MKKFCVLTALILVLGAAAFADDAKVMPMMVGRVYVAPTYSFALGSYDAGANYDSFDDTPGLQLFNLSFALEYGVIDWITAAVQWAPGWTPWSNADNLAASNQSIKTLAAASGKDPEAIVNGVADLFVGAKIQILGEKAPVKSSQFRLALGPGVVVPLPGPDFDEEVDNLLKGDTMTINKLDNHVFAAGARLYFDYIINEHFFINLYNETLFYPLKQDLNKDGPNLAMAKEGLAANLAGPFPALVPELDKIEGEVNYKYRLTFEVEPAYTTSIAPGISVTASLPINYRFIPPYDYSVDVPATLSASPAAGGVNKALAAAGLDEGVPQHSLNLKPTVAFFFTKTPTPLEFELYYDVPVLGKNIAAARHSLTLMAKIYFALPGRPQ